MPKSSSSSKSALKLTRSLFLKSNKISDTDESSDSDDSGDFSHIPIKNLPDLDNLNINTGEMENSTVTMEDISSQMKQITQMFQNLNARQEQYEQQLLAIRQVNTPVEPTPSRIPNIDNFFKIPDPIKMIPTYDGNRRQLSAWLTIAENTLNSFRPYVSEEQMLIYTTAITNKIQGKAKDILCLAGNPQNIDEVKEILTNALGDRQELSTYKSCLWSNKMSDGMPISRYYQRTKEIVQNIKLLAKQNEMYRQSWPAITHFIDEDALAAFIAGLCEPYFGYAQAARPKDLEDAYAFLCKFKAKEITATNMVKPYQKGFTHHKPIATKKSDFEHNHQHQANKSFPNKKNEYERPKNEKPPQSHWEPMETDPSIRSRLTLNRKVLNNNEVTESTVENEIENENYDDNLAINFWQVAESKPQT